jgi:hypothetical protein
MKTSYIEAIIEEIAASVSRLKYLARDDILSVPFEALERIETIGSDLYIEAGKLKKLRSAELEKVFLAGKVDKPGDST